MDYLGNFSLDSGSWLGYFGPARRIFRNSGLGKREDGTKVGYPSDVGMRNLTPVEETPEQKWKRLIREANRANLVSGNANASRRNQDDDSSTLINTIVAAEIASSFVDSSSSIDTSSVDTSSSSSSSDFSGFGGGESGGGGTTSDW